MPNVLPSGSGGPCLPTPSLARSLYQNWLRSLAARANFRGTKLASNDAGVRRDQFTRISFTLHAQAELGDLVKFMYEFYSAGFLHQIRKMDIKPNKSSRDLEVNLTIEALSLPTAESKERLPEQEAGHVLQLAKLSDYRIRSCRETSSPAYVRPRAAAPRRDAKQRSTRPILPS